MSTGTTQDTLVMDDVRADLWLFEPHRQSTICERVMVGVLCGEYEWHTDEGDFPVLCILRQSDGQQVYVVLSEEQWQKAYRQSDITLGDLVVLIEHTLVSRENFRPKSRLEIVKLRSQELE